MSTLKSVDSAVVCHRTYGRSHEQGSQADPEPKERVRVIINNLQSAYHLAIVASTREDAPTPSPQRKQGMNRLLFH